jgi:hypothetical protein
MTAVHPVRREEVMLTVEQKEIIRRDCFSTQIDAANHPGEAYQLQDDSVAGVLRPGSAGLYTEEANAQE